MWTRDWEEGELPEDADLGWKGIYHNCGGFLRAEKAIDNPDSWEDGPKRMVSRDFSEIWFQGDNSVLVNRVNPEFSNEVSKAFAISWPRFEIDEEDEYSSLREGRGFNSSANSVGFPFWTDGPFLNYLRNNWKTALPLIIDLVDFATDRFEESWKYEDNAVVEYKVTIDDVGEVTLRGNDWVYRWGRNGLHAPNLIVVALVSLEKFCDELLANNKSVEEIQR